MLQNNISLILHLKLKTMKKTSTLTTILFAIVFLFSCKKESSESTSSALVGNWKFVSSGGTTSASTSYTLFGTAIKVETILNYTSSNPKGVYKISQTAFSGEGVGYDYQGSLTVKQYEDNTLQSEDTNPVNATIVPTNASTNYKLIGTDSIYFEGSAPGTSTGASGTPGGCKYKIEGTKLSLVNLWIKAPAPASGCIENLCCELTC